jgi:hypothetical protein
VIRKPLRAKKIVTPKAPEFINGGSGIPYISALCVAWEITTVNAAMARIPFNPDK